MSVIFVVVVTAWNIAATDEGKEIIISIDSIYLRTGIYYPLCSTAL